jgi:glycosyltransferase involved in cell wall biosynthesis
MFSPDITRDYSNIYVDTTVYLWLFDFAQKTLLSVTPKETLQEMYNPIIASSLWQAQNISDFLEQKEVSLTIIILPFFVTLLINDVKEYPVLPLSNKNKDINKILFVNDSHKGLSKTISVFKKVRETLPNLTLYIISEQDPKEDEQNNIIHLGPLKRNDVLFHMRKSLCLLQVNDVYPESFGFSHITANLLRTPVITYNNGALHENLEFENSQIMNCRSHYIVAKKIQYLQEHDVDEQINRSNNYSKQNVVDQWVDVLGI